ncbi:hypothetical protein [Arthrospiribacter ruber]|uniref:Lipoprotein n=1 Tax=Arthrospiribacter ruber TaxID=2487934 RepID=A0A951MB45_9BACT|nr:hypothetical protein [Arthrospiribacter ruber]MBW3466647.1 hypothetical protein [Arthrospiribacter ruber]
MKKIQNYLITLLLLFIMSGCVNEDDNPLNNLNNYFTFKIDNRDVEFKGLGIGMIGSGEIEGTNAHSFALSALKSLNSTDDNNFFFLSFADESPDLRLNHTYSFNYESLYVDPDVDPDGWALANVGFVTYYVDDNGVQYTATPISDYDSYGKSTEYTVRFTSINTTSVEGIFSGKFYNDEFDQMVTITDGRFRLFNALGMG